jgi:hypothetical protein
MKTLNHIYEIKWNNNFIIINSENEIKLSKKLRIIIYMIEYLKEITQNKKDVKIILIITYEMDGKILRVQ